MSFIGGKSQSGVWQRIVNLIPPHEIFIELFAGSAAIARLKSPAKKTILIDKHPVAALGELPPNTALLKACGIDYAECLAPKRPTFVYADPPYLLSTRGGRRYYKSEMTDDDHRRLLAALVKLPCPVLLSGYPSGLYDHALAGWGREQFRVMTRGHTWATEVLWFNYPRPTVLHDFSKVGDDFRDRWRIKKKRRRWVARLIRQDPLERAALFSALVDVMGEQAARDAIRSAAGSIATNGAPRAGS